MMTGEVIVGEVCARCWGTVAAVWGDVKVDKLKDGERSRRG